MPFYPYAFTDETGKVHHMEWRGRFDERPETLKGYHDGKEYIARPIIALTAKMASRWTVERSAE